MKGVVASLLLAMAIAYMLAEPAQAITCSDVGKNLGPCISYLRGQQPKPALECCNGVRTLKNMVPTTQDRRFACNCIKLAASRFSDLKDYAISSLPNECSAPLPFPINARVDCKSVP